MWVLVCYLELRNTRMEHLGDNDWEFFSRLFPNKKTILFRELVERRGQKYKWSELAKELYIESERAYFRTPKQCRERWLNHLDPNKSKQEW